MLSFLCDLKHCILKPAIVTKDVIVAILVIIFCRRDILIVMQSSRCQPFMIHLWSNTPVLLLFYFVNESNLRRDSMNMVVSPKLQQMHLCNHLWIYFLLGMLHIHVNFSPCSSRASFVSCDSYMLSVSNSLPMIMFFLGILVSSNGL